MTKVATISEVIETVLEETEGEEEISVADLLESFEHRVYAPVLVLPSVCVLTPLGGIPTFPSFAGLVTVLLAVQLAFGQKRPWIPSKLADRSIKRKKFKNVAEKYDRWFKWTERFLKPRLQIFVKPPATQITGIVCSLLGVVMIPLEVIPFAAAIPAFAIMCLALALLSRDGLLVLIGYSVGAVAAFLFLRGGV